jgi:hypothetical protein
MDVQTLIAGGLVAGCSAWAVWMLLPAGPRARLRSRLGLEAPATSSAGACGGCSGCRGTAPPAGAPQGVTIVRRPRA